MPWMQVHDTTAGYVLLHLGQPRYRRRWLAYRPGQREIPTRGFTRRGTARMAERRWKR